MRLKGATGLIENNFFVRNGFKVRLDRNRLGAVTASVEQPNDSPAHALCFWIDHIGFEKNVSVFHTNAGRRTRRRGELNRSRQLGRRPDDLTFDRSPLLLGERESRKEKSADNCEKSA